MPCYCCQLLIFLLSFLFYLSEREQWLSISDPLGIWLLWPNIIVIPSAFFPSKLLDKNPTWIGKISKRTILLLAILMFDPWETMRALAKCVLWRCIFAQICKKSAVILKKLAWFCFNSCYCITLKSCPINVLNYKKRRTKWPDNASEFNYSWSLVFIVLSLCKFTPFPYSIKYSGLFLALKHIVVHHCPKLFSDIIKLWLTV